jgi:hypothetical protein
MRDHMPSWLVEALVTMYRAIGERGSLATELEVAASGAVLGHPPRRHQDFARQLAAGEPVL